MSNIRLVKREEIDDKLWNGCVHFAINAMPYGYTWFLDNICETWDGLVMGEYRAVMPLVYEKSLGISYLYHPYLARQLGLFSLRMPDRRMFEAFLKAIPPEYKDVQINFSNFGPLSHEGFDFKEQEHYLLDLVDIYPELEQAYSDELKEALKAKQEGYFIKTSTKPEAVVGLFEKHMSRQGAAIRSTDFHSLHRIIYKAQFYSVGQTVGLYKNDLLVASLFYIYSRHSILIYLAASTASEPNGIAMLVDHLILTHAGSKKVLDFGQFLDELAQQQLPEMFGARSFSYWEMTQKKVPWYLKYIRRNGT